MYNKTIPYQHAKRLEYLSTYLRELRFSASLSQNELSQNLNLHRNSIIRAEHNYNMTLLTLFELADGLDISVSELFQDIK
jgi:transcriptional regulator with XRE-family HTH domain